MQRTFFLLLVLVLFSTCERGDKTDTTNTGTATTAAEPLTLSLYCQASEEPSAATGMNSYELYLQSSLLQEPVYIAEMNGCTQVPADQFAQYNIPAEGMAAVNGYFAGGGPLYYAFVDQDSSLIVMQAYQDEEAGPPAASLQYQIFRRVSLDENGKFKVEQFMPQE